MSEITFVEAYEQRYERHQLINWWDQQKLARSRAIVAGAGALGNEVLKLLSLIGFGHILVVDFDVISRSNLARMVLFREQDVGRPKVEVAVERIRDINPDVDIRGVAGDLRFDVGLAEYRTADVVFGCLDSVNARWALNRKCLQAGVTWIDGGISDYHGQITRYSRDSGACYECTFTQATHERFNRRYSCPFGLLSGQGEPKVPTTAVTTSVTAALQVNEALLYLHDQGDGLHSGERLTLYLKPYMLLKDILLANPDCLAHDSLPDQIALIDATPESMTAAGAVDVARQHDPRATALLLPYDLVVAFECPNCHTRQPMMRPKETIHQVEAACPNCGQQRLPVITSRIEPESTLGECSLRALGIPARDVLSFDCGKDRCFLELQH